SDHSAPPSRFPTRRSSDLVRKLILDLLKAPLALAENEEVWREEAGGAGQGNRDYRRPVCREQRRRTQRTQQQHHQRDPSNRPPRSEEHTSELQSPDHLVCR